MFRFPYVFFVDKARKRAYFAGMNALSFPAMTAPRKPKEKREVWSTRLDRPLERKLWQWASQRGLTRRSDIVRHVLAEFLASNSTAA
jgi:hypothetical protein